MEEIKPKYKINDAVDINNENYKGIFTILDYTIEDNIKVSYKTEDGYGNEFWFGEEEIIKRTGNMRDKEI